MAVLKRSNDRLAGGVLAGFAEYVGWPPANMRVLFVLMAIFTCGLPALIAYLVLWLAMPPPDYLPPRH